MERSLRVAALCLVAATLLEPAFAQSPETDRPKRTHEWWHERHPGAPLNSPHAGDLPRVSVRGNRFVDPQGEALLLRGLSISDPDKIEQQGHWTRDTSCA